MVKRFAFGVLLILAGVALLLVMDSRAPVPQSVSPDAAVLPPDAAIATIPILPDASIPAPARVESEAGLMVRLRTEVESNPGTARDLAQDIERRFPGSPMSDERALLSMQALVHLGRIADARSEATDFYVRFPESPLTERVHRLTGMHLPQRPRIHR
jgi:hypothetical protein